MTETVVNTPDGSVGRVTEERSPDRRSVWHNFAGAALGRMRAGPRAHHPSRAVVDDLMFRGFDRRPFDWLDIGVVGMVDYERLRPRMRFRFAGADLSTSVADDARRYLTSAADEIVVWDVETPPPPRLVGRFDLVTLRHVLNHCSYYERPLAHVEEVLRPLGRVVVVLHLALVDGPDDLRRHRSWDVPGEVIGNRYNAERFLRYFADVFVPEAFVRVDDGVKPNDVIVGRRADPGEGRGRAIVTHRMWMPAGRRNAPVRALSRLLLAWRTRGMFGP